MTTRRETSTPIELVSLRDARERVIAQLSDAFAHDVIDVDEFDARLTYAHRATTVADVERLVSDLVDEAPSQAVVVASSHAIVAGRDRDHEEVAAVFGGVEKRGPWVLPRRLRAVAVFGGIVLDLREAVLAPGPSEIHVTAVLGGVHLIVPPHLSVEVSGSAVLGGFEHMDRAPMSPDPERPLLRVHGRATLGGVAIETRLPGESQKEAHRRRTHGPALGPAR